MSRIVSCLILAAAALAAQPAKQTAPPSAARPSAALEARVDAVLKQMTVEEKAGQMTQVTIDVLSAGSATGLSHKLDPSKVETAINKYKVGSVLNVNGEAFPVEHWHKVIDAIQDAAAKNRLKVPVLYGIDSVHGAQYTRGAALLPQAIAVAATWNTDIARRAGEIAAWQTRASGIPWNFYPVLDIGRHPAWPRLWEGYGEDVHIATQMGLAYIEGMQGKDISAPDKVIACLKHYAGYSMPYNGKDRTPALLDERTMRQYVLPPFEAAVRAGVPTVMANSAEINGIPGHANHWLLTTVLKKEWGFQGFTVSDWEDIKRLHTRDKVAATPKEAVRMAVMAGVDMSMVPLDYSFYELLLECAKDGSVPMTRIDDAVRRILRVKFQAGLFERPKGDAKMRAQFERGEFHQANLEAAREAITLLKNAGGVLPLAKGKKILVTGPTADMRSVLNSGWTITWQGDQEHLYPKDKPTILGAIRQAAGAGNVTYAPGTSFDKEIDIPAAVRAAESVDVIVAALGEKAYCETPGNIENLMLDEPQLRLVAELAKLGKPLVVVLAQGRPRVIRPIVPMAQAIVMAYLPGEQGGRAVADVLFGEVNPSGKLPVTYPRGPNGHSTYDYKPLENTGDNPVSFEWPFGHGLSYTTFAYSDLKLSSTKLPQGGSITASVKVTNTGSREGKEVVALYVSDEYRSVSPPNRELKGFQKIALKPGEARTVEFRLTPRDLAFVGLNNKWITEAGTFRVMVGGLTESFSH
ncbi:MAG TPA: beta-glucosidase [Solibacterales bacterium]|nr:beta-glucosidase [Bryobacterales bacterium]